MKQYVLIFRMDITSGEKQPSAEQMQEYMQQWAGWIDEISAQDRMVSGNHLEREGIVIRPEGMEQNLPYTKDQESVAGYIIILAHNQEEAVLIAKKCPILNGQGTSVEVRATAMPG